MMGTVMNVLPHSVQDASGTKTIPYLQPGKLIKREMVPKQNEMTHPQTNINKQP